MPVSKPSQKGNSPANEGGLNPLIPSRNSKSSKKETRILE